MGGGRVAAEVEGEGLSVAREGLDRGSARRRRAYAGCRLQQAAHGCGEPGVVHERVGAEGRALGRHERNADVADAMGRRAGAVPHGVERHEDLPSAGGRSFGPFKTRSLDEGRVGHEVPPPHDVAGGPEVLVLGRSESAEGVLALAQAGPCDLLVFGEDVGDGHVRLGDGPHGNRARDDPHRVRRVPRIVGLPQVVRPPPADDLRVDDGDEGHRLGVLAREFDEEGGVRRRHENGFGRRVRGREGLHGPPGVLDAVGEQGLDLAAVGLAQACLGALKQFDEALFHGLVHPGPGKLDVALQHLAVGHLFDVAEVRLGRLVDRLDDLLAARFDLLGGDLGQKLGGLGARVGDLVEVRVQLGQPGGHSPANLAPAHPALGDAGRRHEQVLDRGARCGLGGGHKRGSDEHAVDGHRRAPVGDGPRAVEVVGGALGVAEPASRANDDAGLAQLRIRRKQQLGKRLPRVVAAGLPVLHHGDERQIHALFVQLAGDLHDLADLRHRAGLEGNVRESLGSQALDELDRLVELGDAGGDDDAVKRRPGRALLRHRAAGSEMQAPQVRVEEHGVELGRAAGFEELAEPVEMVGEDLLGDLPAAGHLRPMSGVSRGGDDLRLDGRRRHAAHEDRRTARQPREGGFNDLPPVDDPGGRGEDGPILGGRLARRSLGKRIAQLGRARFDVVHAGPREVLRGQAREAGSRAKVDDGRPRGHLFAELRDPVKAFREHGAGQIGGVGKRDAAGANPLEHLLHGRFEHRIVEGGGDVEILPLDLERAQGRFEGRGRAGEHFGRRGVLDRQGDVAGKLDVGQVLPFDGDHGCVLAAAARTGEKRLAGGGRADEAREREDLRVVVAQHGRAEDALGVADGRDGLRQGLPHVEVGPVLGKKDSGNCGPCVLGGLKRRPQKIHGPRDRQQLGGHGGEDLFRGVADGAQLRRDRGI